MHRPLKILFLAWNYPPAVGGIESVAFHLRKGLVDLGHELLTLARCGDENSAEEGVSRPASQGFARYQLFALKEGLKYLRSGNVDMILCSGIACAPAAWLLSVLKGVPYMVLAHGSDAARKGGLYRGLMSFLFRRAAGIPANSANTKQILLELGCRQERIEVIHPGVDDTPFPERNKPRAEDIRAKHDLAGRKVVLAAGRLISRKGIIEFVENVMPELVGSVPGVMFVVAGGDAVSSLAHSERLLDRLKQRVADLGLTNNVRVLGNVDDQTLRDLYYCADLFVLPAIPVEGDVEGFGIVFLEAALAGAPALASRIGGIPEAVSSESGVLLEPGDWRGYREQVSSLLKDGKRLEALGRSARERVMREFTWKNISGQYSDFIKKIAGVQA